MKPAADSLVQRWNGRRIFPMATSATLNETRMPHDPTGRGYHAVYREHEVNHCPGCGRTQWIIGRVSAECAFCATALPLAEASMRSHNGPAIIHHKNRTALGHAWAA
jgi:hypothetical protein